jgi:hypothetical protein
MNGQSLCEFLIKPMDRPVLFEIRERIYKDAQIDHVANLVLVSPAPASERIVDNDGAWVIDAIEAFQKRGCFGPQPIQAVPQRIPEVRLPIQEAPQPTQEEPQPRGSYLGFCFKDLWQYCYRRPSAALIANRIDAS